MHVSKTRKAERAPRRGARRAPATAVRLRTPLAGAAPEPLEIRRFDTVAKLAARQRFRGAHIAVLNGEPLLRRDGGWNRRLKRGDRLAFVDLPAGGSGTKNIMRSLLNIALVLTAAWALGPAGLGLSGLPLAAGVAASYVASAYLVNAFLPPDKPGGAGFGGGDAASPTYSLTTSQNRARMGEVRPRLYGRHLIVPDTDAAQWTEFAGNDQYLNLQLNCGLGDYAIHKVMLAQTDIWTETEGYTGAFDGVEIEFCPPGFPVTLFPAEVITSPEVSGLPLPATNEDEAGPAGPFAANPPGTEAMSVAFDLEWRAGAFRFTDSGGLAGVSIQLRFEVRETDQVTGAPAGEWQVLKEETYSFATRTAQRISERFWLTGARYEARVTRINASDAVTNDRVVDAVIWTGLRAFLAGGGGSLDCTRLAIRMKATGQLSGLSARLFRVLETAKLPLYQGRDEQGVPQWSAAQETRSLFASAMDVLRNQVYGAGLPDTRIDLDRFAAIAETWEARGDTFDGIFDRKTSIWKALQDILTAGRAEPVMTGDVVSLQRDEPREAVSGFFTPQNIAAGSFGINYVFADDDTPDDVIVEFWNELTWAPDEVRATLPGSTGANPARIQAFGITDRTRAWKHGMYRAAQNRLRRSFPYFVSGLEGRFLARGKKVLVSHPLPEWGRAADVAGWFPETRLLRLASPIAVEGETWMHLRDPRGRVWGPVRVTQGASASQLVIDEDDLDDVSAAQGAPASFIRTGGNGERSVAVTGPAGGGAGQAQGPMECLVMAAAPARGGRVQLTLVNDDPGVYTADEGEPPAPPAGPVPPSIPAAPNLPPIVVSENIGSRYAPRLAWSVAPAEGADLYIWSLSYDHVTWMALGEGSSLTAGESDVLPSTVWIACTAIGRGGRARRGAFRDLTISDTVPGEVTGVSFDVFFDSAIAKFSLPKVNGEREEGLRGVLLAWGFASGFDPEDEVERDGLARIEPAASRIEFPLDEDQVYVRIAAYNVFGEAGLNWSSEQLVERLSIGPGQLSDAIQNALANAESISGGVVFKIDDDGRLGGLLLVGGDGEPIEAGIQADIFQISHPGIGDGEPFPLFIADETGVRINNLVAATITAQEIYAALVSVGRLEGLIFSSPLGEDETLEDASLVIDTQAPYILMRKPAP